MSSVIVTAAELAQRHIRRSDCVPCSDAFIDCRIPGSMPKDNYSMIGPGVTQNAEQVINLREPHGFQIGAAGMPPGVTNNLHLHFTSETFLCASGHYLLRWGAAGDEGELRLSPSDVACMPTWMFRGFSNVGSDYGFLMTVLGGDDTGGILWSPEVIRKARATGLFLGRDNQLIDTLRPDGSFGDPPPDDALLPPIPPGELAQLRRWSADEMRGRCITLAERDLRPATLDVALPGHGWQLAPAIGFGLSQHRDHRPKVAELQGFSVEWLRVPPGQGSAAFFTDERMVLVQMAGVLGVEFNRGSDGVHATLGLHDTLSVPAGAWRRFVNHGAEPAEAIVVLAGDARKTPHFEPAVVQAALKQDVTLDAGGRLARASVLPPPMD